VFGLTLQGVNLGPEFGVPIYYSQNIKDLYGLPWSPEGPFKLGVSNKLIDQKDFSILGFIITMKTNWGQIL
jgi:hypothetical protein